MKRQILTVTLNPCIDRTIIVDQFHIGMTNYYTILREDVAGKGINVAVALKNLNVPVKSIGFDFKNDHEKLIDMYTKQDLMHEVITVPGSLRINIKIFDREKKEMTECNERGIEIEEKDLQKLFSLLASNLQYSCGLVVNGSVPQGVPADCYKKMIYMANKVGVPTILDATGELLREGMKEKPFLIKPNMEEFMTTFQVDKKDIEKKAQEIAQGGIPYVCVSLGKEGAILADKNGACRMDAIKVDIKGLQGAGDAMVAGICKAIWEGKKDCILPYAIASAASSVMREGTQMGNLNDFNNLLHQISNQ